MEKLLELAKNQTVNEILFSLLILTFPFGSAYLSFSIGFMTIYPNLIILVVLFLLGILRKELPETRLEKFYLFFCVLFFGYAVGFLPLVENRSYALVDVRSIALMLFFGYVLLGQKKFLGFEKWKASLKFNVSVIFILLTGFALVEYLTGFHFAGKTTEHLLSRGLMDMVAYSPLFIWDNPNNFFAYYLLIGVVIILCEKDTKKRAGLGVLIFSLAVFFGFVIMTRVGIALAVLGLVLFAGLSGIMLLRDRAVITKTHIGLIAFAGVSLLLVLISKEKFLGIPKEREMRLSCLAPVFPELHAAYVETIPVDTLQKPHPQDVILSESSDSINYRNSVDERTSLIKNGIDFFSHSGLMGIGPGQFRHYHDSGQVRYYAYGNNGPHFWLIELLSQFGLIITLPYLFLIGLMFFASLKWIRSNWMDFVIYNFAVFCFIGVSLLPSAFLILDINWIFTAILVVMASNGQAGSKKSEA